MKYIKIAFNDKRTFMAGKSLFDLFIMFTDHSGKRSIE